MRPPDAQQPAPGMRRAAKIAGQANRTQPTAVRRLRWCPGPMMSVVCFCGRHHDIAAMTIKASELDYPDPATCPLHLPIGDS